MARLTVTSLFRTVLNWLGRGPKLSTQEIASHGAHRDIWLNNTAPKTASKADHYSY